VVNQFEGLEPLVLILESVIEPKLDFLLKNYTPNSIPNFIYDLIQLKSIVNWRSTSNSTLVPIHVIQNRTRIGFGF
jgi:hypothetical protein